MTDGETLAALCADEDRLRDAIEYLARELLERLTSVAHRRCLNHHGTPDQAERLGMQSWIAVGCQYKEWGWEWDAAAVKRAPDTDAPPKPTQLPA